MEPREDSAYAKAGVDYDALDRFKRHCQQAAASTTKLLARHAMSEPLGIRGESAYLLETPTDYWAHVEEGLGTKNLVADAMIGRLGGVVYRHIGIDVVATIVNDMITVGAIPISVAMHAAVGNSGWFDFESRGEHLAAGFAKGCELSDAVWGGGETPVLKGVVEPNAAVLAGSAFGRIHPKERRIIGNVQHGDAIVMLASSGIHANGITLCRSIADDLPDHFQTKLPSGTSFGEALLAPTVIYVPFIRRCQELAIDLRYAVHITGHGWRKLMRLAAPFVYQITQLPAPMELYEFLSESGNIPASEMYATFNMGAGFAVFVPRSQADNVVEIAKGLGYEAWLAGQIEKQGDRRAVEIVPLGITFEGHTLQVRA